MKKVLVIDDDPDQTEIAVQILTDTETQVRAFTDPLRALAALSSEDADLLIVDLSMPWIGGEDFINSARHRQPSLPIFLISGYSRGLAIAQEAGVHFFAKPVDWDALREAVHRIMRQPADSRPVAAQ